MAGLIYVFEFRIRKNHGTTLEQMKKLMWNLHSSRYDQEVSIPTTPGKQVKAVLRGELLSHG